MGRQFPLSGGFRRKEMKKYLDCFDYICQIRVALGLFAFKRVAFGVRRQRPTPEIECNTCLDSAT